MSDTVFHETNSRSIWSEAFGGTAPSFPDEGFPLSPNASTELKKVNKLIQGKYVFT